MYLPPRDKQALNFSAEPRNSAVFGDFRVIPEVSANLVKKIQRGGRGRVNMGMSYTVGKLSF